MSDPHLSDVRELLMPPIAPNEAAGRIERWHVREGQVVAAGDVLAEVATGSLTREIEAEGNGRIARILVPAGTAGVMVNTPIAILAAGEVQSAPSSLDTAAQRGTGTPPALPTPAATAPALVATLTYREALRDALAEEMERDPSIFVIGADVAQNRGAQKVTQGLLDSFGEARVVTVPPLMDGTAGLAFGAALGRLRPVVELGSWGASLEAVMGSLEAAAEAGSLSGGALSAPVVFRGRNGGAPGVSGLAGHCVAGQLAAVPGLSVVAPSSASTAKALLKAALRATGAVAVLEHELLYGDAGDVGGADDVAELGRARIARPGRDATLVAHGVGVKFALEAALVLNAGGVSAEVIDLMTVAPFDIETVVASARRTQLLIAIEEGPAAGSVGASIVAAAVEHLHGRLVAPPRLLAGDRGPIPYFETLADAGQRLTAAIVAMVKAGRLV